MSDFEDRLKQLLNEQIDHELGGRRQPPAATEQPRRRGRPRPTWMLPLLAAAAVIAAVVGGGVVAHSVAGRDPVAPATDLSSPTEQVSTPTLPPPTGKPSLRSTPSTPPSSTTARPSTARTGSRGSESARPPSGTTVALEGARIALPDGWTSKQFSGAPGVSSWCLLVRGGSDDACAVSLFHYTSLPEGVDLDREGFVGDAQQYLCGDAALTPTEKMRTASFGGRTAEVREFDRSCAASGKTFRTVQYFVPRAPAWALIVVGATSRDRDIAQRIVTGSTLPRETATERLLDRGTIRSLSRGRSGVTVTIERTRYDFGRDRFVDGNETARYLVPTRTYDRSGVESGRRIALQTDGGRVTRFGPDPQA